MLAVKRTAREIENLYLLEWPVNLTFGGWIGFCLLNVGRCDVDQRFGHLPVFEKIADGLAHFGAEHEQIVPSIFNGDLGGMAEPTHDFPGFFGKCAAIQTSIQEQCWRLGIG